MFSYNFFSRVILRSTGTHSALLQKAASSSIGFGNPSMPDKLYKDIILEIRSCEPAVMRSYERFIKTAAQHLNVTVDRIVLKPKPNYNRITLLKSIFVHRKHLVQYEVRTHYSWINLKHLTGSTADTFLEYIERMLPEGVALKVTKVAVEPLPEHINRKSVQESMEMKSVDYFGVDGTLLRHPECSVLKMRERMRDAGAIVVTAVVNKKNKLLAKPKVFALCVFEAQEDAAITQKIIEKIELAFSPQLIKKIRNMIESSMFSTLKEYLLKKPIIEVQIEQV